MVVLLLVGLIPAAVFAAETSARWVPDRILVKHKKGVSKAARDQSLRESGGVEAGIVPQIGYRLVKVKPDRLEEALARLARDPSVERVEKDFLGEQTVVPNDPHYADGSQWHLPRVQAPKAWTFTAGDSNVVIAVIDSGIDPTQADLQGQLLTGFNCFDDGTDVTDLVNGHGTRVAGVAAASSNNGLGVAGVAGGARLLPIKAMNAAGYITWSDAAKAILYAADAGARVINMSFCGSSGAGILEEAIHYAWSKGCVLVAATGNFGSSTPQYPAAYSNVIAVSSTQADDTLSSFSNYGPHVRLAAPGEEIWTTQPAGAFGPAWGTSMAVPIVAGTFALVFAANPALSNADAVTVVQSTAVDLGKKGWDPYYGYGRVDSFAAVQAALQWEASQTARPSAEVVSPSDNSTVAGVVPVEISVSASSEISRVEWYLDGTLRDSAAELPACFSWDTTAVANGPHLLWSKAYDSAGNSGISAAVTVLVQNPLPTLQTLLRVLSPLEGAVLLGKKVKLAAEVSDPSAVRMVKLFVDGVWVRTDSKPPFKFTWKAAAAPSGEHTLEVVACDAAANELASDSIVIQKP